MKPPVVSASLSVATLASIAAAACFALGCSSSPLPGEPGGTSTPSGSSDGDPPALAGPTSTLASYPAGPYGTVRGATIANFSFLGWRHPDVANYDADQLETVRLSDFYDPDGHTGVKILAINASAVWCVVCRGEYQDMATKKIYATYHPQGVEILGTLFEDALYYPAQARDLHNWGVPTTYDVKFPLVLDPGFKLGAFFDSDATPLNMLVDVRTMTIVQVQMGYDPTGYWPGVQALLAKM